MSTIEKLAELAEGATPGGWVFNPTTTATDPSENLTVKSRHRTDKKCSLYRVARLGPFSETTRKDGEFICKAKNNIQQAAAEFAAMRERAEAAERRNAELVEALEIISGKRQCLDNLMSNVDVARAALAHSAQEKANAQ